MDALDHMRASVSYASFSALRVGPRRRELVRSYLEASPGIIGRIAVRASVDPSVVSKVLHGRAVSAPVVRAIEAEERKARAAA